jgi:hypothetical protein
MILTLSVHYTRVSDRPAVVRDRLPDKSLGLRAIRFVIVLQYSLTHLDRRFAGRLGIETRMAGRSIQVNEQTAYGGGHQALQMLLPALLP